TGSFAPRLSGAYVFGVGVIALVFSFPVYLLLDSAVSLWRTQFLSGIGSALVLAAMTGGASSSWRAGPIGRASVLIAGTAVVVWFGSFAAIHKGAAQRLVWERHRAVVAKTLSVAPSVKPNTIIVLINVLREKDPFTHHMWCDLAMRLAYPGIAVAAT